jgi:hypothetical protein
MPRLLGLAENAGLIFFCYPFNLLRQRARCREWASVKKRDLPAHRVLANPGREAGIIVVDLQMGVARN